MVNTMEHARRMAGLYARMIAPRLELPRRRLVAEVPARSRVLDIACGTGELVLALASRGFDVAGVDLDPAKIAHASKRLHTGDRFTVADATALPFEDGHFDVATLSMALHGLALEARRQALTEALRVAPRVLVLDYAVPLPFNLTAWLMRIVERTSPAEHHAGFTSFRAAGGVAPLVASCGAEATRRGSEWSGCLELWSLSSSASDRDSG